MQKKQKNTKYVVCVETLDYGCDSYSVLSSCPLKQLGKEIRKDLMRKYRKYELIDLLIVKEGVDDPNECYDLYGYHKGQVFIGGMKLWQSHLM